jgi:hypothetical protein
MCSTRAQASIETVVLLPVVAALGLGAWQVVLVAWALVSVSDATHAGARAMLSHEPARAAVRSALPGSMRQGLAMHVHAGELSVSVRVPSVIPGYSPSVSATARVPGR